MSGFSGGGSGGGGGRAQTPTATKTANYTAVSGDSVLADASGGAFTVTLPAAASAGTTVEVKKVDTAYAIAVTVAPQNADTIDGFTSVTITQPNSARTFRKDSATNWVTMGSNAPPTGPSNSRFDRLRGLYLPSDTCLVTLRKALARARMGGAPVRYIARGDSTTFGVIGGGGQGNPPILTITTGTTTNTSTTLSNVLNYGNMAVGAGISGTGIPANTTIVSMNQSARTLVMSAAATSTNTNTAISVARVGAAISDIHLINWPSKLRAILGATGAMGGVIGECVTGATTSDARFTIGTGWSGATAASTATGTLTFADDNQANAWDITIQQGNGSVGATFSATVDGGAAQTFTLATTSPQVITLRLTAAAVGAHTLVFSAPSAGTITITMIEPLDTTSAATAPILRISASGVSGQSLAGLAPTNTGAGTNMAALIAFKPDACQLLMGINDMAGWTAGSGTPAAGAATYQANLVAFCQNLQAVNCEPILTVWDSYQDANQNPGTYEALLWHQAIYNAAEQCGAAVIDIARRWGYGTVSTTGAGALYDGIHPTLAGYQDIAKMTANVLADI